MPQEKAIDSCYHFKQSSAGGLRRCEVPVNKLLRDLGCWQIETFIPSYLKKITSHYVFCTLYYQFQAWDWWKFEQVIGYASDSDSSGLSRLPLTVPSSGVVGKKKEREDEQLGPALEPSNPPSFW